MKLIKLTCNNCNAPLEVDIDKLQAYCPYCGQKLLFDLDQMELVLAEKERTKRAKEKTKRAEETTKQSKEATKRAEEETKRTKIRYEYENKKDRRANSDNWVIMLYFVFMFACIAIAFFAYYYEKKEHQINNEIQISVSSKDLKKESVENVKRILKNCGFQYVSTENKRDLVFGLISKEGEIESITINGNKKFSKGDWFPADAVVIITYHGFSSD